MKNTFFWSTDQVSGSLNVMLETLSEEYPLSADNGSIELCFKHVKDSGYSITFDGDTALIEYSTLATAARAVSSAMTGLAGEGDACFETLGIMLDCSRNAVMKVEHFKKWLRRLALMGYNMAMLYTEDTFQLSDTPGFGYQLGAYSLEEIQEVDAYAEKLGIEMIGCVQTLGHLHQILKWNTMQDVRDTPSVIMVEEAETMKLIDKILDFWSRGLKSRRIHIGMDETHDLGRGKYLDKKGYKRGFDLFNGHLQQVNQMCHDRGLKPMIWSDMYFRMGSPQQDYYDLKTEIPEDVKAAIPDNVKLVYWDYYHTDVDFYEKMIELHKDLGHVPLMGSGYGLGRRCGMIMKEPGQPLLHVSKLAVKPA
ncbi:MAG: beta-N-acetylhexosaminidase [Lentisphaerae bacterium]|nr:beta-N-acetylhexosaminidase [Lentisphaerota bacterium]MCP4101443.1 beta-N-acetylhexosaminidase [Lentisphaerota bacterium]